MNRKSPRPSPALIAIATAASLILLFAAFGWISARRNRFTARVEIVDPMIMPAQPKAKLDPAMPLLPDGEVERTALRVREVSALVTGLALFAVNEGLAGRNPATVDVLMRRFIERGLLPPGIAQHAGGVLSSGNAVLYIRYRPEPLAIEVVSLGRARLDGPAILGRIITGEGEAGESALFLARDLGTVPLPAPFLPGSQIAAMNWSVEPLRERVPAPEEWRQIHAWLQGQ